MDGPPCLRKRPANRVLLALCALTVVAACSLSAGDPGVNTPEPAANDPAEIPTAAPAPTDSLIPPTTIPPSATPPSAVIGVETNSGSPPLHRRKHPPVES